MQASGPPGSGKTHLAAAAANTLVARGRAVLFATAPELLALIRDGFDAGRAEDLIDLCQRASFDPAQDRPPLVVNDLGAEQSTGWTVEASP